MENEQYKGVGIDLANVFFVAFEPVFLAEAFYNAVEFKQWLGQRIKNGSLNGYRNLEWKDYKVVFDVITNDKQIYHMGVDFARQSVHITLGPSDVFSLYHRNSSELE